MKFEISVLFENLSRKFKLYQNPTRITGTSHEDQNIFVIIYRSFLLTVSIDKRCRLNENTHLHDCALRQ